MTTTTERIDVLAVMDTHISGLRNASECGGLQFTANACKNVSAELLRVRVAVAELIEAAKEYDEARSALANYKPKPNFDAAFASAADYEPERKLEARVKTATERRRAALARVGAP